MDEQEQPGEQTEEQKQPPSPSSEPQPAADPLLECQKLRDEYLAGWQRAKADYVNLQKELAERLEEEFEAGKRFMLREILPVLDALLMAEKNLPPEARQAGWGSGVNGVAQDFEKRLRDVGLEPIETLDKAFDPVFHESLESVASDRAEGTIVEEVQKGYMYKGRVLRPARVKIAKSQIQMSNVKSNPND